MLWFNNYFFLELNANSYISIHLMLWFNLSFVILLRLLKPFQYILCCGSTNSQSNSQSNLIDFNTSYVVVQLYCFKWNSIAFMISIHLMLWFNKKAHTVHNSQDPISIHLMLWFNRIKSVNDEFRKTFQYILCCGSTNR